MFKNILAIGLFITSGIISTFLYQDTALTGGMGAVMPGMVYTCATILLYLLLRVKPVGNNLIIYFFVMNGTYFVIYYITMMTIWFASLCGIITCGFGALLTFLYTDRFIQKIKFSRIKVFLLGAVGFALNDIFMIDGVAKSLEPLFYIQRDEITAFASTFLFWQSIVGIKLWLTLKAGH